MAELDQDLVDALRKARKIAVLSGAGLSAESGVPTFRGPEGLWKNHDPTELATAEAFRRDPALVWEFYNWRREKVLSTLGLRIVRFGNDEVMRDLSAVVGRIKAYL